MKKKDNLKLDILTSQDEQNYKIISTSSISSLPFSSVEIKSNKIIFRNEGFMIDENSIKNITTGEPLTNPINPKDIEIGNVIGSGAAGNVHLGRFKSTNSSLAIKNINIYDQGARKQFQNDFKILNDNKCENLIKLYGAYFAEGSVKILLEYMNLGSLDNLIKIFKDYKIPEPCIPEPILAKITYQILNALHYLHNIKHQIHRDIKPGNILINSEGVVKLSDFGLSKSLNGNADCSHKFIGSKNFMSPERITGENYGYPSDIWSLGLVIYELATGKYPFGSGKDFLEQIAKIVNGPEPELDSNIYTQNFQHFIKACLKKNPRERLSVLDLYNHPWILDNINKKDSISSWLEQLFKNKNINSNIGLK